MQADYLVVIAHGVGGRGAQLRPLARMMAEYMPKTRFTLPDAPVPYEHDPNGRQWFSVAGITDQNRPARLREAREAFDRAVQEAIRKQGFAHRLHRVALTGFSQGAIMAVDGVMNGRWPVAALAALSGRLVKIPPTDALHVPILLSHGWDDPVIPPQDALNAAAYWADHGVQAELHLWPELGHWFDARTAKTAAAFLYHHLQKVSS